MNLTMTPANNKVYDKLKPIAKQAEWNRLEIVPNDFIIAVMSMQKASHLYKLPLWASIQLPPRGSKEFENMTRAAIAWGKSQPDLFHFKRPTL